MDRFSYLIYEPYRDLLLGMVFVLCAVIQACTGKALTRGQGLVARAEEPRIFWLTVSVFFVLGLAFLVDFSFRVR